MFEFWKLRYSSLALFSVLATSGCVSGLGDAGGPGGASGGDDEHGAPQIAGVLQDSVVISTMILSARVYPTRALLPGTGEDTVDTTPGGQVHLVASQAPGYALMFWHIPRGLTTAGTVDFTAPGDASFYATAWYRPTGGCPGCPPPPPTVTTVAFSNDSDEVLPDTPIASVNVPGAWPGAPSTVVSTAATTPVAITAQPLIAGSGEFAAWLSLDGFAASGRTLTEPALAQDIALALFATPSPDPCAILRTQRDALDPAEFLTIEAYKHALLQANNSLHACERAHGEPLD